MNAACNSDRLSAAALLLYRIGRPPGQHRDGTGALVEDLNDLRLLFQRRLRSTIGMAFIALGADVQFQTSGPVC